MDYSIENEYLHLTVTTFGAQVKSVIRKCDGVEHIWQADPAVWGYHAPILFPHAGKVPDGIIRVDGADYPSGQHGFARLMEHEAVTVEPERIVLALRANAETRKHFPFDFVLYSAFTLEGDTLCHTLTVENPSRQDTLRFGIGYHPAFAVPFDGKHTFRDYELRFSELESPICVNNLPTGLMHGDLYTLAPNIRSIPIDEHLFDNDSHCMVGLRSRTLGLYEKGTGRGVVCEIGDFPYTLIWSKPGEPKFVCIEPWYSLPSKEGASLDWNQKPAAAVLAPGETWSCTLRTEFVR